MAGLYATQPRLGNPSWHKIKSMSYGLASGAFLTIDQGFVHNGAGWVKFHQNLRQLTGLGVAYHSPSQQAAYENAAVCGFSLHPNGYIYYNRAGAVSQTIAWADAPSPTVGNNFYCRATILSLSSTNGRHSVDVTPFNTWYLINDWRTWRVWARQTGFYPQAGGTSYMTIRVDIATAPNDDAIITQGTFTAQSSCDANVYYYYDPGGD